MLRDNLAGLIEPMIDCAGVHALGGHPKSGLTGGCSRSTRLAIVALKRSLRHMFRWKTRRQVERATSPGFELTTVAHGLSAVGTTQHTNHRTIDPQCLENPRPAGAESTLTDNAASPFHAEPRHKPLIKKLNVFVGLLTCVDGANVLNLDGKSSDTVTVTAMFDGKSVSPTRYFRNGSLSSPSDTPVVCFPKVLHAQTPDLHTMLIAK